MTQQPSIDMKEICAAVIEAQNLEISPLEKHHWTIVRICSNHVHSSPDAWIALLSIFLDKIIPLIIDYCKRRWGDRWPETLAKYVAQSALPWD